jgi:hypothetical protein
MIRIENNPVPAARVRQMLGVKELTSPLTMTNQVVASIKELLRSGRRIMTVDFALGRFCGALQEAGIKPNIIAGLLKLNFDHHDGANPGRTATEVTMARLEKYPKLFVGDYAVLSDQVIDADNVCATFTALNPVLAIKHRTDLIEAARYGDYYDNVGEAGLRLALSIDALRFGKNKFGTPFFKLTAEQQGELFNEIMETLPKILDDSSRFKELYGSELSKLRNEAERAISHQLVRPVNDQVAVVDDPGLPRPVAYQVSDRAIVISRKDLGGGRFSYNPVGLNPRVAEYDLSGLWERLRNLENRERTQQGQKTLADRDNWGGREVAGGSPKDEKIGSILNLQQVASEISVYLAEQARRTPR